MNFQELQQTRNEIIAIKVELKDKEGIRSESN
jgi:hypothetical protein